ncbi:MAG: vWA domain-containing protein [Woeseiaceae bacterium]
MASRSDSRLAENILQFCRTLRHAGMPVGPGAVIDAIVAVARTGIRRRDDFRHALRAVLVRGPAESRLFDQAWHIYFRNPRLLERLMALLLPAPEQTADPSAAAPVRRLAEALAAQAAATPDELFLEVDRSDSCSRQEVLRRKDFEQMSLEEQNAAKRLLREAADSWDLRRTRRYRASHSGDRYDPRRSFRRMLRNNGQLIELERRRPAERLPGLVMLCDVSGSMSRYTRMFLQFAHALAGRRRGMHAFVFGTRLTNISRCLRDRDFDQALARLSEEVPDWDGGTRIADSLQRFNVDWGRRVLADNASVILLTDGLERDSRAELEFQMQRLRRSCRKLVWMNPLLRYAEFQPRAAGMRAMLPWVTRLVPAHNVDSIVELQRLLGDAKDDDAARRRRQRGSRAA